MKICVLYRDNDLFKQYVPLLLEGYEVVGKYVIPRGETFEAHKDRVLETERNAIAQWAQMLVTDGTCGSVCYKSKIRTQVNLDAVFSGQIQKRNPDNTVEDNFAWYARAVVRGRPVKNVIVVADQIGDHGFAGKNDSPSRYNLLPWIVQQLQSVFQGVLVQKIQTLEEALEQADDPATLLVLDRHCGVKYVMPETEGWYQSAHNWLYKCMLYILPFETCAAQLASLGNSDFAFDLEDMRRRIEREIAWS